MNRFSRASPGFTMAEMMIVVVLLGLALIPLMNLGSSTHRQTFFTEHHLLATGRARLLLDLCCAVDFELLDALARRSGGSEATVDMDQLCGPGTIPDLLKATTPGAQNYTSKLPNLDHTVRFVRLDDSAGRVDVEVRWKYAGDSRGMDHAARLSRLVHRREVGTHQRYPIQ